MIILMDVDGVVADFIGHLTTMANLTSPVKEWRLEESLTPEEVSRAEESCQERGFCASIPWYAGGKEFVQALKGLGQVYAVTAPMISNPTWESERKDWLAECVSSTHVLSLSSEAKSLVFGDVLIEDRPSTAIRWLKRHPEAYAILIDRPWNQEGSNTFEEGGSHARMLRAASLAEALGMVEGIYMVTR